MSKKKKLKWVLILAILLGIGTAALWHGITISYYTAVSAKVTERIRIAVISDLHSSLYGKEQEKLIRTLQEQKPELILLVGDIADDETPHVGTKLLLAAIGQEYPCYYVTGNHEFWSNEIGAIKEMIRSYGVTILAGDTQVITIRGQQLRICGVDDPDVYLAANSTMNWMQQFARCNTAAGDEIYSILLSHRPENIQLYESSNFDLVVSGHAHGGQVRIPGLINGLYVPNQGWFPEYAGGKYDLGTTDLIVSRGLSKNVRLPRIFNPPELVIIELEPPNNK